MAVAGECDLWDYVLKGYLIDKTEGQVCSMTNVELVVVRICNTFCY